MEQKREFKGVWIPKEIWENEDLTIMEKLFLVEIDSLDGEKGCFASNDYFSKFFKLSKNRCSEIINSLYKKGYISKKEIKKEGTNMIEKRVLKIEKNKYFGIRYSDEGIRYSDRGYSEKCEDNNTLFNNIFNNTTTINNGDSASNFNILKYSEQRNFILSPIQIQQLLEDVKQYSMSEVKKALDIADDNGVRKYSYYKSILERRRTQGDSTKKGVKSNGNRTDRKDYGEELREQGIGFSIDEF